MIHLGCGGIILRKGKVLLIRRVNTKTFNHLWSNPGGSVEEGESLEEACVRELKEEIDVEAMIVRKLGTYEDYQGGRLLGKNKLFGKYTGFLVDIGQSNPKINEPDKIAEIKYWHLNRLPTNIAPYTLQYLRNL
jgi:8-oxo-dGTP diphosphatase